MNELVPHNKRASFGSGVNRSFCLLEMTEVVTGRLGDEILHRHPATL